MTRSRLGPLAAALLLAAGCGGGGSPPGAQYAVGGTATGLRGAGLVLHLGPGSPGQDLPVAADGPFEFPVRLADGAAFTLEVKTQPTGPTQRCQVSPASGTIAGADAAVAVTCVTQSYPVGGTVSGLTGGALVLQNVGGDDLTVTADGPFAFAAPVASGAPFAVTVKAHPASPRQFCAVAGGTGTVVSGPVTSVAVNCRSDVFALGGAVTGLAGTGLRLRLEGVEELGVTAQGSFAFATALPPGQPYQVTVAAQPTHPWQQCTVQGGSGTMPAGAVTSITVSCTTSSFAVGGTVSGLLQVAPPAAQLALADSGGPLLTVAADGPFTFPAPVPSGQAYLVTVEAQPATQVCSVASAGGVVAGAPVADVAVSCGCAPGLGNCDGAAANGCETGLLVSPLHCGGCGRPCTFAHAAASCAAGACQLGACDAGFANCDRDAASGCEAELAVDVRNCGACGVACTYPHAAGSCAERTCAMGRCDDGFGDCDGGPANGCEVDLTSSVSHCGGCGQTCFFVVNAVPACVARTCQVQSCLGTFANCDGSPANGCEVDLATSETSCGACGQACGPGQVCQASACQLPASCAAVLLGNPAAASGPYTIDPDGAGPDPSLQVFCDMVTDGGGWTFFAFVDQLGLAGPFFATDLGIYDPTRGDGGASYGLGATVLQHLGATEYMASLDFTDTGVAQLAGKLVFYQFAAEPGPFTTGPIPCAAPGDFGYRLQSGGAYLPGLFDPLAGCDLDNWWPATTVLDPFSGDPVAGEPLTFFERTVATGLGTGWGAGMMGDGSRNHASWWYAR